MIHSLNSFFSFLATEKKTFASTALSCYLKYFISERYDIVSLWMKARGKILSLYDSTQGNPALTWKCFESLFFSHMTFLFWIVQIGEKLSTKNSCLLIMKCEANNRIAWWVKMSKADLWEMKTPSEIRLRLISSQPNSLSLAYMRLLI